ncbi:hypothetical protein LOZ66_005114 [Ophidiomyces ophidiicola]|nr:hypothetical protein LOZ66_005114 [Ophidiomyces ophidiicola]
MVPFRRTKLLLISVFLVILLVLYLTADQRIQDQGIYKKTVEALEAKHNQQKGNDGSLFEKLRPGKLKPEDKQAVAVDNPKKSTPGEKSGKSVAGRVNVPSTEKGKAAPKDEQDPKVAATEAEFNVILKRSPIIIFSKTYCPYSHSAKHILLKKHSIVPAPFVVELDQHPMGPDLQQLLARNTGRKTVPNTLVNGVSIGGASEVAELEHSGELLGKIKKMVGKRLVEAKRVSEDGK